jgi:hypothetical protein
MKTRLKIIGGGFFAIVVAAIVVILVCPQIAATRNLYFDTNNGRLKVECVSFGRVYQESVEETDYSKLLKNLGFEELPAEWKLANAEELGIRRWFFPQHVSYTYGSIAADAHLFSQLVEVKEPGPAEARQEAAHLRELIQKGNRSETEQYLALLQQNAAAK